ncbi:MAG: 3-oxoadipate enol-lactonase [Boseongicola sp.]|nr:3-oxoadipate enol-lactonase [Boseongicola sp.]
MTICRLEHVDLHYRDDGDPDGTPVAFSSSLGTDYRLWDPILPFLPSGLRLIRYDMRGHGLSSCPRPPYPMGALVADAEALLDHLGVRDSVFVGCSIGGMIAQGLAVKRSDQVRAMVLSNTAVKIGTTEAWQERIDAVKSGGIESLADAVMERWFSREFRATPELVAWRNMLTRQPDDGYIGGSSAISGTDFHATTANLILPTLVIAGSEDGSTPPDLVRETAELVKESRFALIRRAGHLPMVERPEEFAGHLTEFLENLEHD